jgi:surface antigen
VKNKLAVTKYTGTFGDYYANGSLSKDQQKANVLYIGKYLLNKEWTLQAIAGLCGNIESECHFNPGGKEVGGSGYGLIQWTPGDIHQKWCDERGIADSTSMDANLAHIVWEAENNESWSKKEEYTESYLEFTKSKKSAYYLAGAFAWNRERSAITLWGFHRGIKGDLGIKHTDYHVVPSHKNKGRNYCKKEDYDADCETKCKAYKWCYLQKFGQARTEQQVNKNKNDTKETRGKQAEKWFSFLWEKLVARLDDSDTSVLRSKYWVSDEHGGLNYNYTVENWPNDEDKDGIPNAMEGATDEDWRNIGGTYTTLPNCTSWAWGRAYEIMGEEPIKLNGLGDAGSWWNRYEELNKNDKLVNLGYKRSKTPSLGAIACWQNPNNPYKMGHVAIVEAIHDDGTITFSESGYQTWVWRPSYFNVQTNKDPNKAYEHKNYTFMGYISLPGCTARLLLPTIVDFTLKDVSTEGATFNIVIEDPDNNMSNAFYSLNGTKIADLNLTAGEITFSITDLVPNTYYEIMITLEAGAEQVNSEIIPFTTLQDYPDPIKNISIKSNSNKNLETENFKTAITAPERWGYWKDKANNDYGYRVFIVENSKLLNNYDSEEKDQLSVKPTSKKVKHGTNFQVGISTWVTDYSGEKVFALPGELYPVCSNSVILKDISEVSDICYSMVDNEIHRTQLYMKKSGENKIVPLNIFKL